MLQFAKSEYFITISYVAQSVTNLVVNIVIIIIFFSLKRSNFLKEVLH